MSDKLDELGGIEGIREKAAHLHTWTNAQAEWVGALIERVEESERLLEKFQTCSSCGRRIVVPSAKARELVEEK